MKNYVEPRMEEILVKAENILNRSIELPDDDFT